MPRNPRWRVGRYVRFESPLHAGLQVAGDREPKEIREQFKAWCTRRLKVLQQERLRHSPHMIPRPRRFARNGGLSVEAHSLSTTRKALRRSSTTYARHKIMQINLNPTSERGASRDAVNRPRETLGDSHLISSAPRSRFGLVCDLLCCRGNSLGRSVSPRMPPSDPRPSPFRAPIGAAEGSATTRACCPDGAEKSLS